MTLKLYYGPGACSFVPHALLETSGAPFEPVLVKLHKAEQQSPEYLALNPRGQVPVLVDGDHTLTQILAIVGYLHDCFPQHGFLPTEPLARARVMEVLAWMNNTAHPTFTHVFMPHKFTSDTALHAPLQAHNTAVFRAQLGELEALAVRMAQAGQQHLAEPLGGTGFGPLDPYALTLLRWGSLVGLDPAQFPQLWAHVQRVATRPAVARAMARERLQLSLYAGPG